MDKLKSNYQKRRDKALRELYKDSWDYVLEQQYKEYWKDTIASHRPDEETLKRFGIDPDKIRRRYDGLQRKDG